MRSERPGAGQGDSAGHSGPSASAATEVGGYLRAVSREIADPTRGL